jgi:hypothetical protein
LHKKLCGSQRQSKDLGKEKKSLSSGLSFVLPVFYSLCPADYSGFLLSLVGKLFIRNPEIYFHKFECSEVGSPSNKWESSHLYMQEMLECRLGEGKSEVKVAVVFLHRFRQIS